MPMRVDAPLPDLDGATAWLNGQVSREQLEGHPTLIHFWSVSCHICKETLPGVEEWKDKYADDGLNLVSVHVPRQEEDDDPGLVREVARRYHMTQPVALDHNLVISEAFQNEYVPAYYVFDKDAKLRFRAGGDKGFSMVEGRIRRVCGLEE